MKLQCPSAAADGLYTSVKSGLPVVVFSTVISTVIVALVMAVVPAAAMFLLRPASFSLIRALML